MLLILSVLWGGSFFLVALIIDELPPLTIVLCRVTIAAIILWLIVIISGIQVPASKEAWLALFVMGVLNNIIPFTLIVWSQTQIPSGLASILNATTPLFTVILAGVLLADERITRMKLIGVTIGLAGTAYMIGPSALSGLGEHLTAQIAVLGAAISYSLAGVFGRRFRSMGLHPIATAAGQVTASSIMLAPIAFYMDQPLDLPMPAATTWLALIALAVFSTALAYILYFSILASAGATNLVLVTFLIPVSAILLGYFVLGERLDMAHYIGMGIIGVSLLVIDGRLWHRTRKSRRCS